MLAIHADFNRQTLQFWELDTDHDFYITKEDLLRYGNHSLTYRIVDRIFSQASFLELLAYGSMSIKRVR